MNNRKYFFQFNKNIYRIDFFDIILILKNNIITFIGIVYYKNTLNNI